VAISAIVRYDPPPMNRLMLGSRNRLSILAGYTATTLGTRRQGWWAVLAAGVLLVGLAGVRVPS
jgi:hypothetical protein